MPITALAQPASRSVPINLVLETECGARKNEALSDYSQRSLSWCPGTRLMAAFTDTSALAGRRLYVSFELVPGQEGGMPFPFTLSTFTASGQPVSHIGASFQVGQQRLETSVYVPREAASAYLIVSSPHLPQGQRSVTIRDVQARVSDSAFEPGQMCEQCRTYLDEALDRVRHQFLFADRLQLGEMENALRTAATGAAAVGDMDGTMKELARRLAEASMAAGVMAHGQYQTSAEYAAVAAAADPATAQAGPPPFETALLDGQVGLVRLRTFLEADMAAGTAYATGLRAAIVMLHGQGARQWIIDLRSHLGGTLAPAVAAMRPLLGQGPVGYVVDAAGQRQDGWMWGDINLPASVADTYFTAQSPWFDGAGQAVAVLFGPGTMSTGEMLAIAFHGRPRTRSFGLPSGGFTTIVSGRRDRYGNFLGIASGYSADRRGQRIAPRVLPDVTVDQAPAGASAPDQALAAARDWLHQTLPSQ